jgi:AcrR family transcriptional regulator
MGRTQKNGERKGRRNSLGQEDWLQAALESFDEKGVDAVKVLPLSKKLGVTRGSFYWHFEDRDDLLRQMLEYWEHELTDEVIVAASALDGDSVEKLRYVIHTVLFYRKSRYDTAISAWGMFDKRAAQAMKRVLRKRRRFVGRLLEDSGLQKDEAALRARFLIGFLLVDEIVKPNETVKQRTATVERCLSLLFQQPAGREPRPEQAATAGNGL